MTKDKKYRVFVDDNYHYMEEGERYEAGRYSTEREAIEACKRITRESLKDMYGLDITPEKLRALWAMFGEDPFIKGGEDVPFSARDYVTDVLCAEIILECKKEDERKRIAGELVYSIRIQKALGFAIKTHEVYQKQKRKGKDVPYIIHPLTVGLILARADADEDTIIAGILHDTIEDSIKEKKVTKEMIEGRFGGEVAKLVLSVTEINKELPWEERKREAIEHIKTFSNNSVLVKSADIIGNASELLTDFEMNGEQIFARFNAPKAGIIRHYLRAIAALMEKWPENPLVEDLQSITQKLTAIA